MTKIKYLLLFIWMAGCLAACNKDPIEDNHDPVAQFKADTNAIRAFVTKNNLVTVERLTVTSVVKNCVKIFVMTIKLRIN